MGLKFGLRATDLILEGRAFLIIFIIASLSIILDSLSDLLDSNNFMFCRTFSILENQSHVPDFWRSELYSRMFFFRLYLHICDSMDLINRGLFLSRANLFFVIIRSNFLNSFERFGSNDPVQSYILFSCFPTFFSISAFFEIDGTSKSEFINWANIFISLQDG